MTQPSQVLTETAKTIGREAIIKSPLAKESVKTVADKTPQDQTSNHDANHDEDAAKSSRLEKSLGENCKKFLELFGA